MRSLNPTLRINYLISGSNFEKKKQRSSFGYSRLFFCLKTIRLTPLKPDFIRNDVNKDKKKRFQKTVYNFPYFRV